MMALDTYRGLLGVLIVGQFERVAQLNCCVTDLLSSGGCAGEVDIQSRCAQSTIATRSSFFRPFRGLIVELDVVTFRVAIAVVDVIHILAAHFVG